MLKQDNALKNEFSMSFSHEKNFIDYAKLVQVVKRFYLIKTSFAPGSIKGKKNKKGLYLIPVCITC